MSNHYLGLFLINLSFLAVFVMAWKDLGFLSAVGLFATVALTVLCVKVGVVLLNG